MKKIFTVLLPLLVLLVYPNIGNTKVNLPSELTGLTKIEVSVDQGSDVILLTKRGGGGSRSFRSSPRRSTPTRTTPEKKSTWGNKSKNKSISGSRNKKTPTKKSALSKKKTTTKGKKTVAKKTKRKLSKADKKLAAKAKKSGKYHKDRKSARADFKKKNAAKYTSKYKTKPATRPSHIPPSTMVNGTSVNINYNAGYGGYGYMMGGRWMMYDMMTDMIMIDAMMNRTGYVVASELGRPYPIIGPGQYLWNVLLTIIFIIAIAAIIVALTRKGSTDV